MKSILKISLLCTALLLTGCDRINIGNKETETELAAGQRKAEITVLSIVGNELTYREEETETLESEAETETGNDAESGNEIPETGTETERQSEIPETGTETERQSEIPGAVTEAERQSEIPGAVTEAERQGEIPEAGAAENGSQMERGGGAKSGDRMSSGEMSGERLAEGNTGGMSGEKFTGESSGEKSGRMAFGQAPSEGFRNNTFSGETVYLPVGIKVHADNGKVTTFSILEAGDVLQALFETREDGAEMITEIWMEGTY